MMNPRDRKQSGGGARHRDCGGALTTAAQGAADALDSGGLDGLARFRAEQQLTAQATKDAERIFKDYQADMKITGDKALSLAEGLKARTPSCAWPRSGRKRPPALSPR